jgi:hypothetical protein
LPDQLLDPDIDNVSEVFLGLSRLSYGLFQNGLCDLIKGLDLKIGPNGRHMATACARGIIRIEITGLKGDPQIIRNVVDNGGRHVVQIHKIPQTLERFEEQDKTCPRRIVSGV